MDTLERQTRDRTFSKYKPADVERGLQALALCGAPLKAEEETGIPEATLRRWAKHTHAERYQQIRERIMPRIHAEIATESEDLARQWAELERDGLTDLKNSWHDLKPGEKAAALRNATVGRGISIDKANLLRGKPTSIVENRSPDEIFRKLAAAKVASIDSTATEIDTEQDSPDL